VESLDPANLQAMGKSWNLAAENYAQSLGHLRQHGLAIYGTFLFGYDHDDAETIRRSVEFAREQKLFLAAFNQVVRNASSFRATRPVISSRTKASFGASGKSPDSEPGG